MAGKRRPRAALYARVSTKDKDQDPEKQLDALRRLAADKDWEVAGEFVDHASAGDFGARKEWRRFVDLAGRRRFDVLAVFRLDRLARSVIDGASILQQLRHWNVDLVSASEPFIDTTSPWGEAMYHTSMVWAGVMRQAISDQAVASADYVKRHGSRSGKPIGRPKAVGALQNVLEAGLDPDLTSLAAQARKAGLTESTFRRRMEESGYRYVREIGTWEPIEGGPTE